MQSSLDLTKERSGTLNRWLYILVGIIIMMCLGTVYSYSVFRLSIETSFDASRTQSGIPYMVALASYAIFMLITGKLINKFSPKKIVIVGGVLVSLGWILSYYSSSIVMLTLTYGLISGSGVGIAYGVPMSVAARWFPDKKGLAVGMVLIGFGMSPLITAPLARMLVENYGIFDTFLIMGILFGLLIPLLAMILKYPSEEEIARYNVNILAKNVELNIKTNEMVKSKSFIGLYINFILGAMIGLMLIGLTSTIGVEFIKLPSKRVAFLIAIFAIFNGLGRPTFGWLTDKLSPKKAMFISFSLIFLASLLMMFSKEGSVNIYILAFSTFWFNLGGWLAIAPASTMVLYGSSTYSQNYGVVFTAYGIAAIVGVTTSGILIDLFSNYHYIFIYIMSLCLLGILVTYKFLKDI